MSQAYEAFALGNSTMATNNTALKGILRQICKSCIIAFDDNSYLVYTAGKNWRSDKLEIITCQDDLPFCPIDLDLVDLSKENWGD